MHTHVQISNHAEHRPRPLASCTTADQFGSLPVRWYLHSARPYFFLRSEINAGGIHVIHTHDATQAVKVAARAAPGATKLGWTCCERALQLQIRHSQCSHEGFVIACLVRGQHPSLLDLVFSQCRCAVDWGKGIMCRCYRMSRTTVPSVGMDPDL